VPRHRFAFLLTLGVTACASSPPASSVVAAEVVPRSTVAPPVIVPFYAEDPILEGLEPTHPWFFRQETWSEESGEHAQHCREQGYPARLREEIASTLNAAFVRRGIPAKLPDSVRVPNFSAALGDFSSRLVVPSEPLVKLVLCSEATMPRSNLLRLTTELRRWQTAGVLAPLGEPTMAWKREYADHHVECGLRWKGMTRESVRQVLGPLGYAESTEDTYTAVWRLEDRAMGRLPGSELWWSAVRDAPR
jgi:hypothetical protein